MPQPPESADWKLYAMSAGIFFAFYTVTILSFFYPTPEGSTSQVFALTWQALVFGTAGYWYGSSKQGNSK